MNEPGLVQIVMPMGGLGQRFRDVGIETPKALIEVDGMPMFRRALASFEGWAGEMRVVVVARDEQLADSVRAARGDLDLEVLVLAEPTRGAVETVLAARDLVDPAVPLVSLDCDNAFESPRYFEELARAGDGEWDGLLLGFESDDPRYSFAAADGEGRVTRTAEKVAISPWALMGCYTFARTGDFIESGDRLLAHGLAGAREFYLSAVFNRLIADGRRVRLVTGEFHCFGTPEELTAYEERRNRQLRGS